MFCCDVSFVCTVRSRNGKLSPYGYIMCRENRSPATYCLAWCGVNFWLRGPRLTASCHWNVPECGTSGSSVEYAMCLVVVVVGLGASLSFGSFFPSSVVYCYSSINLSQLLAAWAQRLPTFLKLAIGLAGYRVGWLSGCSVLLEFSC